MKQKLELLRQQAIDLIKDPTIDDPAALARLGPIPSKLQQLERQFREFEEEVARIEKFIRDSSNIHEQPTHQSHHVIGHETLVPASPSARREQKKIRVEIDLAQLGASGGKRVICEHKASDSLVNFLELLYRVKGPAILEKLTSFSVNRAVLVSKNPRTDYRYRSRDGEAEYQHQAISDSGFFAMTQSATKEKIADIRRAWQFLNLPTGALKVEEADKYES